MDYAHFTETEKSKKSEVKCENDAVFFNVRRIVHREFVPSAQAVNQAFYLEILRRQNVRRKRSHSFVTRYLASLGWTVVPHPLYALDLAPCDIFLLPILIKNTKGSQ